MATSSAFGRTAPIHGIEMYYEERGQGEPLVLLHGFTGSSADWIHLFDIEALSREYRLITPDMRGHGRSTNPPATFTIRQCALDVFALLDHLGIDRFRAIGLSLGAKTLLHMATQKPSRVAAMALVSAAPYFPEQARALMRAMASAEHTPEEWTLMRERHQHGDEQIRALWQLAKGFADTYDDMTFTPPHLATITARTLLVSGDSDPLYPVELAVELYRSIPRSSLWIVPSAGHTPVFTDARDTFVRTALAFLRQDPEPSAPAPHQDA